MEIILNEYHKKVNAEMRVKMEYYKAHPLPREEALRRLKLLREERLARLENKNNDTCHDGIRTLCDRHEVS